MGHGGRGTSRRGTKQNTWQGKHNDMGFRLDPEEAALAQRRQRALVKGIGAWMEMKQAEEAESVAHACERGYAAASEWIAAGGRLED